VERNEQNYVLVLCMITIELRSRDIRAPGLYLMRWKNQTGLVRIIAQPDGGWRLLIPEKGPEHLMQGLPFNGTIPDDAMLSEPLAPQVA
jgi:hypothetical protein